MFFAKMSLNPTFNYSFDLGSQDIDQNYDWINNPRQWYSNTNLMGIDTFLNIDSRINVEVEENLT